MSELDGKLEKENDHAIKLQSHHQSHATCEDDARLRQQQASDLITAFLRRYRTAQMVADMMWKAQEHAMNLAQAEEQAVAAKSRADEEKRLEIQAAKRRGLGGHMQGRAMTKAQAAAEKRVKAMEASDAALALEADYERASKAEENATRQAAAAMAQCVAAEASVNKAEEVEKAAILALEANAREQIQVAESRDAAEARLVAAQMAFKAAEEVAVEAGEAAHAASRRADEGSADDAKLLAKESRNAWDAKDAATVAVLEATAVVTSATEALHEAEREKAHVIKHHETEEQAAIEARRALDDRRAQHSECSTRAAEMARVAEAARIATEAKDTAHRAKNAEATALESAALAAEAKAMAENLKVAEEESSKAEALRQRRERAEDARLKELEQRKVSEEEEFARIEKKREEAEKRLRTKEMAMKAKKEANAQRADAERAEAAAEPVALGEKSAAREATQQTVQEEGHRHMELLNAGSKLSDRATDVQQPPRTLADIEQDEPPFPASSSPRHAGENAGCARPVVHSAPPSRDWGGVADMDMVPRTRHVPQRQRVKQVNKFFTPTASFFGAHAHPPTRASRPPSRAASASAIRLNARDRPWASPPAAMLGIQPEPVRLLKPSVVAKMRSEIQRSQENEARSFEEKEAVFARVAIERSQLLRAGDQEGVILRHEKQERRTHRDLRYAAKARLYHEKQYIMAISREKTLAKLIDTARRPILRTHLAGPGLVRAAMSDAALKPPNPNSRSPVPQGTPSRKDWSDLPKMLEAEAAASEAGSRPSSAKPKASRPKPRSLDL